MNVTRHGGFFHRKNCPTSNRICEGMEAHLSRLNPCGSIRSAQLSDVAMSVSASTDVVTSVQPVTADGKVLLAWDGRLDNKSGIVANHKLESDETGEDAVFVATAYLAAGPELWPDIIGDYAVACWDSARRELYLARDPFGTRPLYYYINDSAVIWCSELSYFIELFGDALNLDDEFIASYLLAAEAQSRTPYRDISSVQPGYVTIISKEQVSHHQLWDPASCGDVRLRTDSDYEARFRDLFAQSVERRLRTPGVAIAELSGGLDSSSIVSMAHEVLRADKSGQARLATVSYIYDGSRTGDEREFIKEVEQLRGVETSFIQDKNAVPLSSAPRAPRPSGLHLFHETYETLREFVGSINGSILLSGLGGDEITLNEETFCPDLISLLKRGRPIAAFRAARRWAQARKSTTIDLFWSGAVLPLLPLRLQAMLDSGTLFPKSWMGPTLAARLGLSEYPLSHGARRLSDPVRRRQYKALNRAMAFASQCYHREQGCCDVTYPFLDRCLIEFLVGIPADQKLRPTETRSIHRRAMKDILPEKIRLRKTKQGPEESLLRALSRSWPDLIAIFRDAEVYKRGYINGQSFAGELTRARHGICRSTAALARVLSLELWLRAYSDEQARHKQHSRAHRATNRESCCT